MVRKDGPETAFLTRWGRSLAQAFPEAAEALRDLADGVYDGELVVPDAESRSDFAELRRRFLLQRPRLIEAAATKTPAVLVLFDILALNGTDLRHLPLIERKALLAAHVQPLPHLQVVESIGIHGEALFAVICTHDCEGVIAKRLDAPYRAGRQSSWVKIKNQRYSRQEAIIWSGR
jgi:bifunctional non-homologous end joining protein LigD